MFKCTRVTAYMNVSGDLKFHFEALMAYIFPCMLWFRLEIPDVHVYVNEKKSGLSVRVGAI